MFRKFDANSSSRRKLEDHLLRPLNTVTSPAPELPLQQKAGPHLVLSKASVGRERSWPNRPVAGILSSTHLIWQVPARPGNSDNCSRIVRWFPKILAIDVSPETSYPDSCEDRCILEILGLCNLPQGPLHKNLVGPK